MSYTHAENVCKCFNGHLARTDTRKQNGKIALMAPMKNKIYLEMWIGYSDRIQTGRWIDSAGTPPRINNWGTSSTGGPLPDHQIRKIDGVTETQHCAIINYRMRTLWDDDWCSKLHYSACQTHRTETHRFDYYQILHFYYF